MAVWIYCIRQFNSKISLKHTVLTRVVTVLDKYTCCDMSRLELQVHPLVDLQVAQTDLTIERHHRYSDPLVRGTRSNQQ